MPASGVRLGCSSPASWCWLLEPLGSQHQLLEQFGSLTSSCGVGTVCVPKPAAGGQSSVSASWQLEWDHGHLVGGSVMVCPGELADMECVRGRCACVHKEQAGRAGE